MATRARFRKILAPLDVLAEAWIARVRTPRRRVALAALALVTVAALLWARHGTTSARVLAATSVLVPVVALLVARGLEARLWRDPARVIRRVAGGIDPEGAARALRALTLLSPDGAAAGEGTSAELSRLHVVRVIAGLPQDRAILAADTLGRRLAHGALAVAALALLLFAVNAWRVMEGLDVIAAVRGVAPVDVLWFDDVEMTARLPDYLHEDERKVRAYGAVALPRGTLLTVRGTLLHPGRQAVLTDGTNEVPFVDDGAGGVVARWPLEGSVNLSVSARFGQVVIREPEKTRVTSIADEPPKVTLQGAPRKVTLATDAGDGNIPIRYEAEDDHGLREVHLVLRSGTREERRALAHLDGEVREDRGGYLLRANDPFFKKSHAPVEVTVEAKDNDPITGPKWGASAAIVVVLPDIGGPEAARLDALRKLRDAWVDVLAFRLGHGVPDAAADRRALARDEAKGGIEAEDLLETTFGATYEGVRVAGRLQAMLRGQSRKVREAMTQEGKGPTVATHKALVGATEQLVLVVDAVVRGLGQKDAQKACRKLADVADDLAEGFTQMQRPPDHERGLLRTDAGTHVLEGGGRSLERLGAFGRDLGEIVATDLSRVARARGADDFVHAEIAARDLAARLREQDPSFGGGGRGHGRAGGESGGGRGTPGEDDGDADEVEKAFNMAAQDVERLAADHATELGKVEQALNAATSDADVEELAEEAKKHAEAVRNAVRGLPATSLGSDSWTGKGSAARENAEAMARALERGAPADAVSSGKSALDALDEAKQAVDRERWNGFFPKIDGDPDRELAGKSLEEARQKLEPEVKWAEDQLARLRKRAEARQSGELSGDADEERKLAERAAELEKTGRDGQALPEESLDALEEAERVAREAAEALKQGDVERGLDRQREAQRQLEMAKEALGGDSKEGEGDGDGSDGDDTSHVDIPTENGKGAEQFRKRVIHGLSQAAGTGQKDAIRRYAEELLR